MKLQRFLLLVTGLIVFMACETDDDAATETGVAQFSITQVREVENATLGLTVNVGIDRANHSGGTIDVQIAGATYGEDYTTSADAASFTLEVAPNSLISSFSIVPTDDDIVEDTEELSITLTNATGGLVLGENTLLSYTILDDDDPQSSLVSFVNETQSVPEEATDEVTVGLTLSAPAVTAGSVTITATGNAILGTDYTIVGQTDTSFSIPVAAGDTTASFNIQTVDNAVFEADKDIVFTITEVSSGLTIGTIPATTVTIINDDVLDNPTIDFNASNPVTLSEDAGAVTITFDLSEPTTEDATVTIALSGAAVLGIDYDVDGTADTPYVFNVPSGATTATITLNVTDDTDVEDTEDIILTITETTGGLTPGIDLQEITITLDDNDSDSSGLDYLETFEGFDDTEDYLTATLGYTQLLNGQTVDNTRFIDVINNAGSFTDPDDVSQTSDNGLNIFYNTQNDPANNGLLDNVLVTPLLEGTGDITVNIDAAYAFRNQNAATITFYFSESYDGSSAFDEAEWTVMGTETVAAMDGEGFGNNDYKREDFSINTGANFYVAIRINQEMDDTNFRTRWRFDNIRAVAQ